MRERTSQSQEIVRDHDDVFYLFLQKQKLAQRSIPTGYLLTDALVAMLAGSFAIEVSRDLLNLTQLCSSSLAGYANALNPN